jgi:hypothetical protein
MLFLQVWYRFFLLNFYRDLMFIHCVPLPFSWVGDSLLYKINQLFLNLNFPFITVLGTYFSLQPILLHVDFIPRSKALT